MQTRLKFDNEADLLAAMRATARRECAKARELWKVGFAEEGQTLSREQVKPDPRPRPKGFEISGCGYMAPAWQGLATLRRTGSLYIINTCKTPSPRYGSGKS